MACDTAGGLSEAELRRRRPVWSALSDLFLDTETRWFMPRTALALCESGYTPAELEAIWHRELVPECAYNLLDIAGEWVALSLDEAALLRRVARGPSLLERGAASAAEAVLGDQWERVLDLRALLAAEPPARARDLAEIWTHFAHAYLETSLDGMLCLRSHVERLAAVGWAKADLLVSFEGAFRLVYRRLLIGDERATEAERAACVLALIERALG